MPIWSNPLSTRSTLFLQGFLCPSPQVQPTFSAHVQSQDNERDGRVCTAAHTSAGGGENAPNPPRAQADELEPTS